MIIILSDIVCILIKWRLSTFDVCFYICTIKNLNSMIVQTLSVLIYHDMNCSLLLYIHQESYLMLIFTVISVLIHTQLALSQTTKLPNFHMCVGMAIKINCTRINKDCLIGKKYSTRTLEVMGNSFSSSFRMYLKCY